MCRDLIRGEGPFMESCIDCGGFNYGVGFNCGGHSNITEKIAITTVKDNLQIGFKCRESSHRGKCMAEEIWFAEEV